MALHLSGSISLTGSLTAGTSQTNTGTLSTIAGGAFNTVSGNCSFIGAGNSNQATGGYSTAVGGRYSCALQDFAFVGGGCLNKACSCFSSVAGGLCNTVAPTSVRAFIGGGQSNTISSEYDNASIVAGICNMICGNENNSFIGGGANNLTKDSANSVIVGGRQNHLCSANYSTIAGGWFNSGSGAYSFIGGGERNSLSGYYYNSIVGGCRNCIECSPNSTIAGGSNNTISVGYQGGHFIGAGALNCILPLGYYHSILGGARNTINTLGQDCYYGVILGGRQNLIANEFSSIVNGCLNTGSGAYGFIGGGARNEISSSAVSSSILGGFDNLTNLSNTHIIGSGLIADKANYTYVNNLDVEGTVSASIFSGSFVGDGSGLTGISGGGGGDYSPFITGSINSTGILPREGNNSLIVGQNATVAGGTLNTGSGQCTFIGGGQINRASTQHAAVVAGCKNRAFSPESVVVGGHDNHACANQSFIGAGRYNRVEGFTGGIVSGDSNCISSAVNYSFIGGGTLNTASAHCSAILGGDRNYISSSLNNSFIVGSDITADKACYTFMNNLDVEGTVSASIFSGSFVGDGSGLTGIGGGGGGGDYSPFITGSVSTGILPTEGSNCSTIGANSTIAGGTLNTGSGVCSFIGSGRKNNLTAFSIGSAIIAGEINLLSGSVNSAIVAGCCNILNSLSGYYGSANGSDYSIIGAGLRNELFKSDYSAIVSGRNNCLGSSTHCSFIGAGSCNTGSGDNSFIGTGCGNLIDTVTSYSSILNGRDNYLRASCSTIVGGCRNCLGCNINGGSTIAGGVGNHLFGDPGFIGAGANNRIEEYHGSNSIVGGVSNLISGSAHDLSGIGGGINPAHSFIGGGRLNTGSASYIFIGGGCRNIINSFSTGSAILGGHCNTVNHDNSFIIGSCLTSNEVCTTYMNNTVITGSLTVGQTGSLNSTVGRIDATNDIVGFSTSDRRLKENIQPIENALSKVIGVSGNTFDWKPLSEEEVKTIHGNKGRDVGVIAQEIEEILPEAVTTRDSGYKAVNYEKIVPLLIEAIKEQQKQIDELKSRL